MVLGKSQVVVSVVIDLDGTVHIPLEGKQRLAGVVLRERRFKSPEPGHVEFSNFLADAHQFLNILDVILSQGIHQQA